MFPRSGPGLGLPPDCRLVIAGSIHRGEDEPVIEAFRSAAATRRDLCLLVAPRHPERLEEVERLVVKAGVPCVRRSRLPAESAREGGAILLDTMGELARLYAAASVVFVGGSLIPHGGQNILEPAAYGRPMLHGPHMGNFAEMRDRFREAEAALQVADGPALAEGLQALLDDRRQGGADGPGGPDASWRRSGERRGGRRIWWERCCDRPRSPRGLRRSARRGRSRRRAAERVARGALAAVSLVYGGGRCGSRNAGYDSGLFPVHRLPCRVVSVGNLTVGGTGKTPTVMTMAAALRRGWGTGVHRASRVPRRRDRRPGGVRRAERPIGLARGRGRGGAAGAVAAGCAGGRRRRSGCGGTTGHRRVPPGDDPSRRRISTPADPSG